MKQTSFHHATRFSLVTCSGDLVDNGLFGSFDNVFLASVADNISSAVESVSRNKSKPPVTTARSNKLPGINDNSPSQDRKNHLR